MAVILRLVLCAALVLGLTLGFWGCKQAEYGEKAPGTAEEEAGGYGETGGEAGGYGETGGGEAGGYGETGGYGESGGGETGGYGQ